MRLGNVEMSKRVKIDTWARVHFRALQQLVCHTQSTLYSRSFHLLNLCKPMQGLFQEEARWIPDSTCPLMASNDFRHVMYCQF